MSMNCLDFLSVFLNELPLFRTPLSPIAVRIFTDGKENRNVPIIVSLTEPQIWSLEMLDSLADLYYVILSGQ